MVCGSPGTCELRARRTAAGFLFAAGQQTYPGEVIPPAVEDHAAPTSISTDLDEAWVVFTAVVPPVAGVLRARASACRQRRCVNPVAGTVG